MRIAGRTVALTLAWLIAWPSGSAAQTITADTAAGRKTDTVVANGGPNYTISGGQLRGTNLFHSFSEFNVPTGGSATFVPDSSFPPSWRVDNVLNRVTGPNSSFIDGTISTRALDTPGVANANFFLINPKGVMFGAGAVLDVSGAVRISTADFIRLDNGAEFSATNPAEVPTGALFTSPPQAFGFLSSNPAPITVDGAFLCVEPCISGDPGLPAQTLSLVGGDVQLLNGAIVFAPGGLVQIVSVRSPGVEPGIVDLNTPNLTDFSQLGTVTVSGGSVIAAGGNDFGIPGGTVVIRGGQLVVDTGGLILSDTGDSPGANPGIDINVRESMIVSNGGLVQTISFGGAEASDISIKTGSLTVTDTGSAIESQANSSGKTGAIGIEVGTAQIISGGVIRTVSAVSNAGDVNLTATGTLALAGAGSEIATGAGGSSTDPNLIAGAISLSAADISLSDSAKIRSGDGAVGEQAGGTLSVTAADTLSISSLAGITSRTFLQSAGPVEIWASQVVLNSGYIATNTFGPASAGAILVNANSVSLTNGAQIASSSTLGAPGPGGSITINAPASISISGIASGAGVGDPNLTGTLKANSGLFSTAKGAGNAGQISLSTPTLSLADGGLVSVATEAAGSAGTIMADVGSFNISGGARVDSSTKAGGAGGAIAVNGSLSISGAQSGLFSTTSSTGDAGAITVTGPTVTLAEGGRISVTTTGAGKAGTILVDVGSLGITGGGRIDSSTSGAGAGGAITLNGAVSISGTGSGLFSNATGAGNAGLITVSGSVMLVTGGGTIDSSTTGVGAGGAINISVSDSVEISNGGSVRADSLGDGNTGSITIAAGDRIMMEGGSISTRAATSDGGNITLLAPNVIRLTDSQITTSVETGTGGGGNIFIDPQFVLLEGSSITANAFGGPGGNITIIANAFLADAASVITASSALSAPGTVEKPENNVAGEIAQLPKELVDASRLMQGACSARRAGAPSSFTVAGRGGVPADPDGYLPSYSTSEAPRRAAAGEGLALAMAGWDCWR